MAFQKYSVVPDIIPKAPASVLEVCYPNGINVDKGNILTPTQVKDLPKITWNAESGAFYTLCFTTAGKHDPNAPSDSKYPEWLLWLVGNIPGTDIDKGEALAEYVSAAPPPETGLYRCVFLIYKQDGKITFNEKKLTNKSDADREKFAIKTFADKYKLGNLVSGNFFQAEYDDYVPIVWRKLGGNC